ncbi:MAG TPA: DinB family protein [Ktedonobacterales bacterium]|nr:DinB family protein [Ktedonobacterales bacterium]
MANEASHVASLLDYIGREALQQLRSVPEALLNQPLTLPETNTLFALATHLVGAGEFWVLVMAGERMIPRDRLAEFYATGTLAELVARYERWIADVHKVLDSLPDEAMERVVNPPATFQPRKLDQPMTVRDCLLHAVEHSALHQGHIQLTCQLLRHQGSSLAG